MVGHDATNRKKKIEITFVVEMFIHCLIMLLVNHN